MSLEGKSPEEIQALAALADSVLNDPRSRRPFQRLLKVASPSLQLPEVDLEDMVEARTKPLREKIEKDANDRELERQQQAAQALRGNLKAAGAIKNDEDFNALVTYATANGYQTTEAGLKLASRARADELEAAEPTPHGAPHQVMPMDAKGIMKDPIGWARQTAHTAMTDLVKNRGRAPA